MESWLDELSDGGFVVIDEDSEELLVRTFVKWDGGITNGKRTLAIDSASKAIRSPILRRSLALELLKLGVEPRFEWSEDVSADEYPIDTLCEPYDIPYRADPDTRRDVVKNVSSSTGNQNPKTANREPGAPAADEPAAPAAKSSKVGTRLTEDWQPPPHLVAWVKAECPNIDGRTHTDNFRDYWHAKTGRDSTKLDWDATYRKWMRDEQLKAQRYQPRNTKPVVRRSTTDDAVNQTLEMARRYAEEDAANPPPARLGIAR